MPPIAAMSASMPTLRCDDEAARSPLKLLQAAPVDRLQRLITE
ncbi:hypothetical protein [Streptomyces sp. 891-h]|nr:hypothetical protein [Streptomyces sp. 891-h]